MAAGVERRVRAAAGALLGETPCRWERLQPALTGEVSHAEWMASVADALTAVGDPDRARAAVDEWQRYRGEVDPDVLAFVREVRAAGRPGRAGHQRHRPARRRPGRAGPDRRVRRGGQLLGARGAQAGAASTSRPACAALGTPPARVLFVDDEDRAVAGARAAGLSAHRWSGPAELIATCGRRWRTEPAAAAQSGAGLAGVCRAGRR